MQQSGRSPLTLVVASVSSAAAAVVARELWAPGTIASAALTPLLVALFGELLHRPAYRLTHAARQHLAGRMDAEVSLTAWSLRMPARWRHVLGTTAAAFLIGSVALTGWELLIHHSLANARDRTTLWGGSVRRQSTRATGEPSQTKTSRVLPASASGTRKSRVDSKKPAHGKTKSTTTKTTATRSGPPGTTSTTATTTTATTPTATTTTPTVTTTTPNVTTTTTSPPQLPPPA
ncbi:MAG: hypothetical protein ACXVGE_22370 [Blastococcus sp.]